MTPYKFSSQSLSSGDRMSVSAQRIFARRMSTGRVILVDTSGRDRESRLTGHSQAETGERDGHDGSSARSSFRPPRYPTPFFRHAEEVYTSTYLDAYEFSRRILLYRFFGEVC